VEASPTEKEEIMGISLSIPDGIYTVVYLNGDHRTLRVQTKKQGAFAGRTIASFLSGRNNETDYTGFGFLIDGDLRFWRRFAEAQSPERLRRIRRALEIIAADPQQAGLAYALQSGNCCRCGRTLTVPASIHQGMGPECARRYGWSTITAVAA